LRHFEDDRRISVTEDSSQRVEPHHRDSDTSSCGHLHGRLVTRTIGEGAALFADGYRRFHVQRPQDLGDDHWHSIETEVTRLDRSILGAFEFWDLPIGDFYSLFCITYRHGMNRSSRRMLMQLFDDLDHSS